jgi:hypothetical protein
VSKKKNHEAIPNGRTDEDFPIFRQGGGSQDIYREGSLDFDVSRFGN